MDYYSVINETIGKQIELSNRNFILYPFGERGIMTKSILNWRFGISEAYIIDNYLSKTNDNIKELDFLREIDTTKYMVLVTSDSREIYDEIRLQLRQYVQDENIVDLFPKKALLSTDPRIATLELAAREIYEKHIGGSVAEAGVFQGYYAQYINRFFSDRKLYLFDTFDGFDEMELKTEISSKLCKGNNWEKYCTSTATETVLGKMPYRDNCIIKKGLFPDTAKNLEDEFCFVSLDMDLYHPILSGLEYFYPKLVKGGYIFIHDFESTAWLGPKKAVREFCDKYNVGYVIISDSERTAVITK